MKLTDIVSRVNKQLAGDRLSYDKMLIFLDRTIDDINDKLGSIYPVFSELPAGTLEYTVIPDKWIRQVVIIGVAWYFYSMDEEGIQTAPQFQLDYYDGLNSMQRLAFNDVPLEFQRQTNTGLVFDAESQTGERGLVFNGYQITP